LELPIVLGNFKVITLILTHKNILIYLNYSLRRNIEDIKRGNQVIQKNSLLMSEMNQTQGLKIGIIGCGKLGRQLAVSLLEFSKVQPNELQISTRQPENLSKSVHNLYRSVLKIIFILEFSLNNIFHLN
jgi:hypothetical protein